MSLRKRKRLLCQRSNVKASHLAKLMTPGVGLRWLQLQARERLCRSLSLHGAHVGDVNTTVRFPMHRDVLLVPEAHQLFAKTIQRYGYYHRDT